jgi:pyruvate dehydrogenase E1 component alpha subunit/lipoate synthase
VVERLIKPDWIRTTLKVNPTFERIKKDVKSKGIATVCQESLCPNLSECWCSGTATFMLLGNTCTRGCRFCNVNTSTSPNPPDPDEHKKLVDSIRMLKLNYVVLTSVDRDDLPDMGATHISKCIRYIKKNMPRIKIEVLIPDFQGDRKLIRKIVNAGPDVVAHNIETVERLTPKVRDKRAGYSQSLSVLRYIKQLDSRLYTKSSIMLGLGEKKSEVETVMDDLISSGVSFLTMGQYLQPTKKQLPVSSYISLETFKYYGVLANHKGFLYAASGPYVRSSYKAGELFISTILKGGEKNMEFPAKNVTVLDESGNCSDTLGLSDDDLRTIYWHMNLSRVLNAKMLNLQKQGRLGTFASTHGQEGCQVALAYAIRKYNNVWLAPTFRENVMMVAKGVPMDQILRYWGGYESGSMLKDFKILPVSIPIGSQSLHAVGIAMAMNIKNEKGAAIAFLGDGATSEGEFHEAMNFAGVFKAPVIFFCQNNQYAISTPREKQTATKTIAEKAAAYGFEGVQVDGNDVFACYKAVMQAVDKAYNGGGATFIEALTYRMHNHTTADDWKKYRKEEEVKAWEAKDPVLRLKKYMVSKHIWNDTMESDMMADANTKVDEAVKSYENTSKPKVSEIFDYLYDTLPPLIQEEKDAAVKYWGEHQ